MLRLKLRLDHSYVLHVDLNSHCNKLQALQEQGENELHAGQLQTDIATAEQNTRE